MSLLPSILIGVAAKVGAPVIKGILERRVGKAGADLADAVIGAIARRADANPESLESLPPKQIEEAVKQAEAEAADIITQFTEQQRMAHDLQMAEMEKGPLWTWAWRPAGMWLVLSLFCYGLVVVPLIRLFRPGMEPFALDTLMQFGGVYMSLYLGGHTAKYAFDKWRKR
jgi:hypothetical protein